MACSSSCSGSAGAGCTGCGGTCSSGCTGCSGSCSGKCSGGCSGGCTGTCTDTCANNCSGKCNSECTGGAFMEITNLTLKDIYTQSDIQAISDAIYYEAGPNRRNKNPIEVNFTIGELISNAKMLAIINNLIKAGQSITTDDYSVAIGKKALKDFGNTLIEKVKSSYSEIIEG